MMKLSMPYRVVMTLFLLFPLCSSTSAAAPPQPLDRPGAEKEMALSPPWQLSSPESDGKIAGEGAPIEPELLRALLQAAADDSFRVILQLREQADLQAAAGGDLSATETRSRVVSALQTTATNSQSLLRPYLEGGAGRR